MDSKSSFGESKSDSMSNLSVEMKRDSILFDIYD